MTAPTPIRRAGEESTPIRPPASHTGENGPTRNRVQQKVGPSSFPALHSLTRNTVSRVFGLSPAKLSKLLSDYRLPCNEDGTIDFPKFLAAMSSTMMEAVDHPQIDFDQMDLDTLCQISGLPYTEIRKAVKSGELEINDNGTIRMLEFREWYLNAGASIYRERSLKEQKIAAEIKYKTAQTEKLSSIFIRRDEMNQILVAIANGYKHYFAQFINKNLHRFEAKTRDELQILFDSLGKELSNQFVANLEKVDIKKLKADETREVHHDLQ